MKTTVDKKKQLVGCLFGLTAGLAFSFFAWGMDGFLLAQAHGAYPWIKFLLGLPFGLVGGALVGWLTVKIPKGLIDILLWVSLSLLFSWLMFWIPLKATPYLIGFSNNFLGNYLDYPFYSDLLQVQWFAFAIIAVAAIICALLENTLIDQALFGTGNFSVIIPILVSLIFFGLAGNTTDSMFNKHIREPIQKVDQLVQFALDNQNVEVSPETRREMHLAALNSVSNYITSDRKLILSNFDQTFGQIDVLVNFNGYWIKCTTIYSQVTYCKEALNIPKSLLSRFFMMSDKFFLRFDTLNL